MTCVCACCDEQTVQIQTKRSTRRYRLRLVDGESISGNEWELQHDRVSTGVDVLLANRAIDHIDIWEKRASFVLFSSAQIARARQTHRRRERNVPRLCRAVSLTKRAEMLGWEAGTAFFDCSTSGSAGLQCSNLPCVLNARKGALSALFVFRRSLSPLC